MTDKKQTIANLNKLKTFHNGSYGADINRAIKALEQEPCEDAISRQAVLDALDNHKYSNEFCEEHHIDWSINLGMAHIVINDLPPVKPQEPTEWQQDHEILKAYSDGANEMLDKIRSEVEDINPWAIRYAPLEDGDTRPKIVTNVKNHVLEIIDKYRIK